MKTYIFDPSSSITVYELSQIIKGLRLLIDENTHKTLPKDLQSHFKEIVYGVGQEPEDNYQGA